MPPPAIVSGPFEVPVGENGCFASVTRSLPSLPVYLWAKAGADAASAAVSSKVVSAFMRTPPRLRSVHFTASPSRDHPAARRMFGPRPWR